MALRPRLAVYAFTAGATALLAGTVGLDVLRQYETSIAEIRRESAVLTRVLEEHARQSMRRVESVLADAADEAARLPGSAGRAELRRVLLRNLPVDGMIRGFVVLDAASGFHVSTYEEGSEIWRLPREQDLVSGATERGGSRLIFGVPARGIGSQRVQIPIYLRTKGRGGRDSGTIVAMLDPGYFQPFYDSIDTGADGFVTLFLRSGWIAVRAPFDEAVRAKRWNDAPLFQEHLVKSERGTVQQVVAADGVERIYSYRALSDYPLVVTTGVSLRHALAPWRDATRRNLAILAVALAAVLAGGIFLARELRRREIADADLRTAKEQLDRALEASGVSLWDADLRTGRVVLGATWTKLIGGGSGETVTTLDALMALVHPDDFPEAQRVSLETMKGLRDSYAIEHSVRTIDGQWKWILSRGQVPERDPRTGKALRMIGTNLDITERKRAERQVQQLAHYDPLTGAANRALFEDRLARALARSRRRSTQLALLYLDIDKFKGINDSLGHAAGDALLRDFASRLRGAVRGTDTVARLGGDEFAVLLDDLAERKIAARIAEKILATMRVPVLLEGAEVAFTTSIGVAFASDSDAQGDALLRRADGALYQAKQAGRNTFRVAG